MYHFNVLPFGPTNAPMYFQQIMNKIFNELDYVIVYLDDICIISDSLDEHKIHLQTVFNKIRKYNMKLRIDKCLFGMNDVEYLGFRINKNGLYPKDTYMNKILNVPKPITKQQLQRFIGLVTFLHQFIPQIHKPISILIIVPTEFASGCCFL